MKWSLEYGPHLADLQATGVLDADPTILEELPELTPGTEWLFDAWQELQYSRVSLGFGLGSIPFEAVDRYARRYGIEGDEFERLLAIIRRLDALYLKLIKSDKDE